MIADTIDPANHTDLYGLLQPSEAAPNMNLMLHSSRS